MKLILANNQTPTFVDYYDKLATQSRSGLEYASYEHLLFSFNDNIEVTNTVSGRQLTDYDGVYINGYLSTYEPAAAAALCCGALGIPFVNKELRNAPSLSKLTAYAKLAAAQVAIPRTLAGSKTAILRATQVQTEGLFPAVLKRADADRGIDNFKVTSFEQAAELLAAYDARSLWILQTFVPNDGYYVISYYNNKPVFSIFRTLEARPDGDELKAHMYKPKGGINATLLEVDQLQSTLAQTAQRAMEAMNRQIGSVDCLYNSATDSVHVLEVNYNPQLVTIETFQEVRKQAFLDNLEEKW